MIGAFVALGAALGVVVLTGCGDRAGEEPSADRLAECYEQAETSSAVAWWLDLDGDGVYEVARLAEPNGPCAGMVVAEVAGQVVAVDAGLRTPDPDVDDAVAILTIPGRTGSLLVLVEGRSGGEFQPRVFGYADGAIAELTVAGAPMLPTMPSDRTAQPVGVRCVAGGLVMEQAVAHTPPGVLYTWDIMATHYRIDGNSVSAGPRVKAVDNVLDEHLTSDHAHLVRGDLFTDCEGSPTAS